jgi:Ubiquitin fusion degradation protein UFD1
MNEYGVNPYYKITCINPIDTWPKYRACMEYSDKLILPYSILLNIRKTHQPLPPLFQISLLKSRSLKVTTGALYFSSEEHHGYFPAWVLKKINYNHKKKEEIVLEFYNVNKSNLYPYPVLKRIEVYMENIPDLDMAKKALAAYSLLSKGDWIKIMIEEIVYKVYVLALYPKNKCIIKDYHFEISVKVFLPKVLPKQDPNYEIKSNKRVMSLDRTKAKFFEMLKSRGIDQTFHHPPLKHQNHNKILSGNLNSLRYSAYNWRASIPPISQKNIDKGFYDNVELEPWNQDDKSHTKDNSSQTPSMPPLSRYYKYQEILWK